MYFGLEIGIPGQLICYLKYGYSFITVVIIGIMTEYNNQEYTSFIHPLRDCVMRLHNRLTFTKEMHNNCILRPPIYHILPCTAVLHIVVAPELMTILIGI